MNDAQPDPAPQWDGHSQERRDALAASEPTSGVVDGQKTPASSDLLLQLVNDGRRLRVELALARGAPETWPILPATQQVLDRLTTFQAAIEAQLDELERSTLPAMPAPAVGSQPIGQLLPWIVLTAFAASGATLVVAQCRRRLKTDPPCRLKSDPGMGPARWLPAVDNSTSLLVLS
jgi:hypothetical protein